MIKNLALSLQVSLLSLLKIWPNDPLSEQKGEEMAEHKPFAEKGDQNYVLFTARK